MAESLTIFGLTLTPMTVILSLAALFLIVGYALGASFSTRGVTVSKASTIDKTDNSGVLKGINSMLANDTDRAIKELSKVVEQQAGSVETYIALGHLFRSKGQFDRAVAIRQSIIARRHIHHKIKIQALFDMGIDYHQGGFLSRSIEAFEQVLTEDARHVGAMGQIVHAFEELQEWDKALEAQKRLDKRTGKSHNAILAHLKCQRGKELANKGEAQQAQAAFKKALNWDRGCVDALLNWGDLQLEQGDLKHALATWRKISQVAPQMCFMALERVIGREWGPKEAKLVDDFIIGSASESKDPRAQLILARHLAARGKESETIEALKRVIDTSECYLPAHQDLGLVYLERGNMEDTLAGYRNLLECLQGTEPEFQCRSCGFSSPQMYWKCPSCKKWDTFNPAN